MPSSRVVVPFFNVGVGVYGSDPGKHYFLSDSAGGEGASYWIGRNATSQFQFNIPVAGEGQLTVNDAELLFWNANRLRVADDIPVFFGSDSDWGILYDEAASDSLILQEGSVPALFIRGIDPVSRAATNDVDGNNIFLRTQSGGPDVAVDGGQDGGDIHILTGVGSVSGNAGNADGNGGDIFLTLGASVVGGVGPVGRRGQVQVSGELIMSSGRFEFSKGSDVASANDIALGGAAEGNYFDVTEVTQINRISNVNWQAGSDIFLQFDGIVTVKHSQAPGGVFATILLAGSVDLVTSARTRLWLKYNGLEFEEWGRTVA